MHKEIQTENIEFIHKEHMDWLNQLSFYQDEIKFFNHELEAVLNENPKSFSKIEYVEEYRLIFNKKTDQIVQLRSQVLAQEKLLCKVDQKISGDLSKHQLLRTEILDFIGRFELLKRNFKRFAAYND